MKLNKVMNGVEFVAETAEERSLLDQFDFNLREVRVIAVGHQHVPADGIGRETDRIVLSVPEYPSFILLIQQAGRKTVSGFRKLGRLLFGQFSCHVVRRLAINSNPKK